MGRGRKKKAFHKGQHKTGTGMLKFFILKYLSKHSDKTYTYKQIQGKIKVKNSKDSILHALTVLEKKNLVIQEPGGRYRWNPENRNEDTQELMPTKLLTGRVDMTRSGAAYIVVDELDQDIYVPARNTMTAMHRDIVRVEIPSRSGRRKPDGRIVEILSRAVTHVIGNLRIFKNYGIVYPVLKGNFPEVMIATTELKGAKDEDNVLVEITEWGKGQNKSIWGRVDKVLGHLDDHDLAMQSILMSNGIQIEFPKNVLKEAENIDGTITEEMIASRRDMRDVLTFTIDPTTAKDFDDALSYRVLENGHMEIGVHIADVTQYLRENSALDKEAFDRSTSVYLVDRVVPMLPERLSNDLCSLNPNEDKCTFSVVYTFDAQYKVVAEWIGRTLIHSRRRFTYDEAQERIESGEGDLASEIRIVHSIAQKIRKDRFKNGAINFESDEVQFVLDEKNKPVGIKVKEMKDANHLIEEFMLMANKSVATFLYKKAKPEVPAVYRIHDMPDMDRLADFALFAREMGYPMKLDNPNKIASSLNQLTKASHHDEGLRMLLPLAIRTMAKAEYSTNNIGHYGLAFDYYSHFTSPIRRYSDVLIHRILFENLDDVKRRDKEDLEQKCKHISRQERKAMDAERESVKYKQVEYMMDKIGQTFHGVISGMIEKGIFVEVVESKAEGLIPFKNLGAHYDLDNSRLKAVSRRTGDELKMGARVLIRLDDADLENRLLEFTLLEVEASR